MGVSKSASEIAASAVYRSARFCKDRDLWRCRTEMEQAAAFLRYAGCSRPKLVLNLEDRSPHAVKNP